MHFIDYIQVTNCLRTALLPQKRRHEIAFPTFRRNTETAVETPVFMVKI
jgi:hypothetical protein